MKKSSCHAFTLVELIVVIAIIGLLASLLMPEMQKGLDKAKSVACMANLRQIGVGVTSYLADHDQTFPFIEPDPSDPAYPAGDSEAKPLLEALTAYGVTPQILHCPMDQGATGYFATKGTSYQWVPILDGETTINPEIYGWRGVMKVPLSRVRICIDYEPVHFNRCNRLYGDGHVVAQLKDP